LSPSVDTVVFSGLVEEFPLAAPLAAIVFTPDVKSVQVKLAVTLVLFQPLVLATGLREPVIVGGVLSIFTAGEVNVSELPATSVTVTVPVAASPSPVTTRGLVDGAVEATPERASEAVKENETC